LGEFKIFLPFAQEEAEVCVAYATTIEAGQPAETVREALEQTIWRLPKKKKRMSILRNGSMLSARKIEKKEAATLKLTAEEAEE
jgi:hypothetical protein